MLRAKLATFVFVAILFFGNRQEPFDDPAALQGEWEIISVERQGFPDPSPVGHTIRFTDNEVHFEALHGALVMRPTFHEMNLRIPS